MALEKIKKRDGRIVDFDIKKVINAISNATLAVKGRTDPEKSKNIAETVVKIMEERYVGKGMPTVEEIQDLVEESLMRLGLYDVAKAYILYRERHRQLREAKSEGIMKLIKEKTLRVIKKNGTVENFDEDKLRKFLQIASKDYSGVVDIDEILFSIERGLYDGIESRKISELAIMTVKSLIEKDPAYSVITARLFLNNLYKEVIKNKFNQSTLETQYRERFIENIKYEVSKGFLSERMLEFDLKKISEFLVPKRDELLTETSLQTLYDRYFIKEVSGKESRLETPQMFWMRVAMGIAINEKNKEEYAKTFYKVLSELRFVASTPTLFNSGTTFQQLSSCYLTTVEDDLAHIFKSYSDNAQLSKWSGGLGNDWSNVRATGALIKSTKVESQGVIPFLKIANDVTVAINRSGKRRGATCAYLEAWHMDVEEFIDLRRNTGDERRRTHDMDTALWIPDLFMKRILEDGTWTLFSPNEVPELHHIYGSTFEEQYKKYEAMAEKGEVQMHKKIKAKDLWRKIITSLYETGHPWVTFKDSCNVRSPQDHVGVVHSSNLCTEITLNTSKDETAVCNLGSINLSKMIKDGELNEELIKETTKIAMRMLDNVIDINYYPTKEARNSNMRHRPVGLGIMGFQDALYALDISFDSESMVKFADESMELISYYAILASTELAEERGSYETFNGSKWSRDILPIDTIKLLEKERNMKINVPLSSVKDWTVVREAIKKKGMRNSNCMAIAPTATISNISNCYPSIEPIYKVMYVKSNMSGQFTIVEEHLIEDLKALGLWNKNILEEIKFRDGSIQNINNIPKKIRDKYKTAFEISPEWLIKAAAYRGKWIDQSQSLNIFTDTESGKILSNIYITAWMMGLKTTYYLRSLGASSIEKSTVDVNKWKEKSDVAVVAVEKVKEVEILEQIDIKKEEISQNEIQGKACKLGLEGGDDCEACQ